MFQRRAADIIALNTFDVAVGQGRDASPLLPLTANCKTNQQDGCTDGCMKGFCGCQTRISKIKIKLVYLQNNQKKVTNVAPVHRFAGQVLGARVKEIDSKSLQMNRIF